MHSIRDTSNDVQCVSVIGKAIWVLNYCRLDKQTCFIVFSKTEDTETSLKGFHSNLEEQ